MKNIVVPQATISDHPSDWVSDWYSQPAFDAAGYQCELNKIVGLSEGEPIVRLDWGGTTFEQIFTAWDKLGTPIKTERRPKYKFLRVNPITDITEEIPIRRWIIADRVEPAMYRAGMDEDIMFIDTDGISKQRMEKPKNGYYTPLIVIGDHTKCPPDCSDNKFCYGDYKHPSIDELLWIKASWKNFHQMKKRELKKALDPKKITELSNAANKQAKENGEIARQKHMDEFRKDFFRTHGHGLKEDWADKYMFINPEHRINYGNANSSTANDPGDNAEK